MQAGESLSVPDLVELFLVSSASRMEAGALLPLVPSSPFFLTLWIPKGQILLFFIISFKLVLFNFEFPSA